MATERISKYVSGFGLSFLVTSIASALLVIIKEENEAVMAWMKAFSGHHWMTQGILIISLFTILGFVFSRIPLEKNNIEEKLTIMILSGVLVGAFLITGFFLLE